MRLIGQMKEYADKCVSKWGFLELGEEELFCGSYSFERRKVRKPMESLSPSLM